MANLACISEPISWLRLETFVLGGATDAGIRDHVAACPACKHCLDDIQRDVVALPALHVPATPRRWWRFALPTFGALAVAALLLVLLRPRAAEQDAIAHIKGIGDVVIDVVRERAGSVRDDVRTFRAGDRFKVVVTCAPSHEVSLAVAIRERGAGSDDHPLAPARIVCGNRIVLPGAFELTGDQPHRVCVRVEDQANACLTLAPE